MKPASASRDSLKRVDPASDATGPLKRAVRMTTPHTPDQLHAYIRCVLGFTIPRRAMVQGHDAPFAYIEHSFFDDRRPRDCIVWANRGGGKTQLGAIATLLDMLFKPGIEIRILGGSFDQSSRMYRYLRRSLETEVFRDLIDGNFTGQSVQLINGSRVEVLAQSQRAVRGQRVHKLRCDEVELFDPEVWEAAQLVTRSGRCGDRVIPASIETLSTMHRPFGMMQKLIKQARDTQRKVFRWSVLDVLRRCEPERDCRQCPLWSDCRGTAKSANGFVDIDDAIQQQQRVGDDTWASEMLCEQPNRSDTVYPMFDASIHVTTFNAPDPARSTWLGGADFGYRAPTVFLWAFVDDDDMLHIVDELLVRRHTTEQVLTQVRERAWPRPAWIGADPAGHQRNEHTGQSTISLWRRAGYTVRTRGLMIEAGLGAVRRRLRRADGEVSMRIHPRCEQLIEALTVYHYPSDRPEVDQPVKDGPDHCADALRYLVTNLDSTSWGVSVRRY